MIFVKYPFALAVTFLWIGFVCAISFLEAWLKFRAPGITIPLGLGIGRLVFSALNKIEWVLAIAIIADILFSKGHLFELKNVFFILPFFILLAQTAIVLPILDARAEMHIMGQDVLHSNVHFYYVGCEVVKVFSLFIFGIKLFNSTLNT